jgi:AmiR/NasT family two-component response regulator
VFEAEGGGEPLPETLDDGGRELVAGLAEAHAVRVTIQRAIGVTMGRENCTAEDAYRRLEASATAVGATLRETATGLLTEQR